MVAQTQKQNKNMLKVFTFWSAKHNDVLYAVAYSAVEAYKILKEKLIMDDDDSYIVGTSVKCTYGACNSTTIVS